MTRSFRALPLLVLLVVAPHAFATAWDAPPDDAAIQAVIAHYFDALNAHDADAQVALFADGATFFWAEGETYVMTDRAAMLEEGRRWHQQMSALRVHPAGPVEVHFLNDDVATASVLASASMGEESVGQMHILFVLHQTPDGWMITTEHQAMLRPSEG